MRQKGVERLTRQEYHDLLVATSEAGGFPAINPRPDGRDVDCSFSTPDGRRCAVGVLLPLDQAAALEKALGGWCLSDVLPSIEDFIPENVNKEEMKLVQLAHDQLAYSWSHERFVKAIAFLKVPATT